MILYRRDNKDSQDKEYRGLYNWIIQKMYTSPPMENTKKENLLAKKKSHATTIIWKSESIEIQKRFFKYGWINIFKIKLPKKNRCSVSFNATTKPQSKKFKSFFITYKYNDSIYDHVSALQLPPYLSTHEQLNNWGKYNISSCCQEQCGKIQFRKIGL